MARETIKAALSRKAGLEDFLWALLNTKEFQFNHYGAIAMPSKSDCGIVPETIWGRRDFLRIGSLGALGLNLRDLMAATNGVSDERSVILVWLSGGPPSSTRSIWLVGMGLKVPRTSSGAFGFLPAA